jgi:putative DNA primase/helicase
MQFEDFARAHGLIIRTLNDDGEPHRVPTDNHPKKRNGAYMFDGRSGWVQDWAIHENAIAWRADRGRTIEMIVPKRDMEAEREAEARKRALASDEAAAIIARCSYDSHPYLTRKGFPNQRGLVDTDGRLVVPMRDMRDYKHVVNVQRIPGHGLKLFLKGGAASLAGFVIGAGREAWLVEGYATGLSVRAALENLHRPARVVVCFSAGNIPKVAAILGGARYVMADNDKSGTGCRVAKSTGLPWTMPPTEGYDANDMHQASGLGALVKLMRELIHGSK